MRPSNPYSATKAAAEFLVTSYWDKYKVHLTRYEKNILNLIWASPVGLDSPLHVVSFCLRVGSFLSSLPEVTTFMARGSTPRRYMPHLLIYSNGLSVSCCGFGSKIKTLLEFCQVIPRFLSLLQMDKKWFVCIQYTDIYCCCDIRIQNMHLFLQFLRIETKKGFCFSTAPSREPSQYLGTSCLSMMPSKPSCCSWKRELWEKSTTWGPHVRFPSYSSPESLLRWWDDSNTMQTWGCECWQWPFGSGEERARLRSDWLAGVCAWQVRKLAQE